MAHGTLHPSSELDHVGCVEQLLAHVRLNYVTVLDDVRHIVGPLESVLNDQRESLVFVNCFTRIWSAPCRML